ncbi:MAG: hypothetical protein GC203_10470 [Phenylobacterium sp.]|uniref:hypothetical protein n=1 Tax=Phenylobacterium sp. TaxID=1871053 RepID=UPI0025DBAE77|nr:hypothetical protein [Phenylobacterium sp.]MBI1198275.1 hypothetical protein [Phenylobacterium sp.]
MAARAKAPTAPDDEHLHRVISAAFDPDFYRAVYTDLPAHEGAILHYRVHGWREGRDPAPWFSVDAYLEENPDVRKARIEPFFHFLTKGRGQGREVRPSRHALLYFDSVGWRPRAWSVEGFALGHEALARRAARREPAVLDEGARAAVAEAFDAAYYLAVNPDVRAAGTDPLEHFLSAGWREGRDPAPWFSVSHYLEANPDVAAAAMNPFAHYLLAGRDEGRAPRHDLGFRYDVIAGLRPTAERIAEAAARAAVAVTQAPEILAEALAGLGDLHVTLSHDHYLEHGGGLQFCVRREAARFGAMGIDHLHLFPATPWPGVRASGERGPLGVLLNGRRIGAFEPATVRDVLAAHPAPGARRSFAIHSLLGHGADDTADILAAAGLREGFFWLHDFASLCAGFHLLRNEVQDCAAPPADSPACAVCVHGSARARHLEVHGRLFDRLSLTVVAPSQTTLDFWRAHTGLPAARAAVLPHARLVDRGPAPKVPAERPFRLAFLGMPVALKGWPVFRELAQRFADDPRYEFHHLGGRSDPAAPAVFHPVSVTDETPDAMQAALEAVEADAALIWPLCRETFSFTAYEAAAAGAAVLTGPDSGNVAAFAAEGHGRVLADEAALRAAFESGEILALGRNLRRARLCGLEHSGMSADLVAETRP